MAESSFGPYGWSKVLLGQAGAIVVSRDSMQILAKEFEAAQTQSDQTHDSFRIIIQKACHRHAEQHADGTMTFFLFLSSLMDTFFSSTNAICGINRLNMLLAVQSILYVFHTHMGHICDEMIKANLMLEMNGASSEVIRGLLLNMLVPASNVNIAENLVNVITNWFTENQLLSSSDTTTFFENVLNHFDTFFISSSIGTMTDSYVLPKDHVLLDGNCRDISFVSSHHNDQKNKLFSFVCIENVCDKEGTGELVSGNKTTLQLAGGLSALASSEAARDVTNVAMMTALPLLTRHGIKIIFSTTPAKGISPGVLYHMSMHGIVLIDSIPSPQLHLLGLASGVPVFHDSQSFIESILERSSSSHGQCRGIERVSMGYSSGFSNSYLRVWGITSHRSSGCSDNINVRVRQTVVRGCGSVIVTGMYRRLLKRCVKVLQSFNMHKQTIRALPGCGINEMNWSIIWDEVTELLEVEEKKEEKCSRYSNSSSFSPLQILSLRICHGILSRYDSQSNAQSWSSSVEVLSDDIHRIKSQLSRCVLQTVVQVTRALSEAYMAVPRLLLANRMAGVQSPGLKSIEVHRTALLWKKHFTSVYCGKYYKMNGNSLLAVRRNTYGAVINLGLLDCRKSSHCAANSVQVPTTTHLNTLSSPASFFQGFLSALECVRLYLRIGGSSGIMNIVRRRPVSSAQNAATVKTRRGDIHNSYDSDDDCDFD